MGRDLSQRGSAMERFMQAMCVLLLFLISFTFVAAAGPTSQPTMPRPLLKGSMAAEGVIDGNGVLVIHMKRELVAVSRNTPMGYPPPPKIIPPYHG